MSCGRTRRGVIQDISVVRTGVAQLWRRSSVMPGMRAFGIPVHRGG